MRDIQDKKERLNFGKESAVNNPLRIIKKKTSNPFFSFRPSFFIRK
jgi:hypothetical protein